MIVQKMSAIAQTMWELGHFEFSTHYPRYGRVALIKYLGPKMADLPTNMYIRVFEDEKNDACT
jgi:hypothetical protein